MVWRVTFRADVYFGARLESEHEIVLIADTDKVAESYARWYFQHHGKWSRGANLHGNEILSEPRISNLRVEEIQKLVVYNGRTFVDKQVPKQSE